MIPLAVTIEITTIMISGAIVGLIGGFVGFLMRRAVTKRDDEIKQLKAQESKKNEDLEDRVKKLEDARTEQTVKNAINEQFQKSSKESDKLADENYKQIMGKLESIKEVLSTRIQEVADTLTGDISGLREEFHQLELRIGK